jgi:hypothetical protein
MLKLSDDQSPSRWSGQNSCVTFEVWGSEWKPEGWGWPEHQPLRQRSLWLLEDSQVTCPKTKQRKSCKEWGLCRRIGFKDSKTCFTLVSVVLLLWVGGGVDEGTGDRNHPDELESHQRWAPQGWAVGRRAVRERKSSQERGGPFLGWGGKQVDS